MIINKSVYVYVFCSSENLTNMSFWKYILKEKYNLMNIFLKFRNVIIKYEFKKIKGDIISTATFVNMKR